MKRKGYSNKAAVEKPDIFRYHDYRAFLKDWLAYLKSKDEDLSLRALGQRSGLTAAYISMVLSGARNLTLKALFKLMPRLNLGKSEQTYFENLVKLGTFDSSEGKFSAMDKMTRYTNYQKNNPGEARFVEFMGKWYHLAIHQMARLPDFSPEPEWIRGKLNFSVTLQQVREALEFLLGSGYLKKEDDGRMISSDDTLKCKEDIYTTVLIECYKQMFTLATASMEKTPPEERNLEGFTVTMNPKRFDKARAILSRALDEIERLEKSEDGPNDSVYQIEVALFPLTKRGKL